MTEATAAQFALTIASCLYAVWLAVCLRQTRKELNDLKSRIAKPGDVSRLIEQYERDLAKGEGFVPKTYPMPTPVPECWKPHKAHDIVRELKRQEMDDLCKRIMDVPAAWSRVQDSPSFGGGDFGGSGAGDSYGSSDVGGSSSND